MLIYVDDIILTTTNTNFIQELIMKLGIEFALKDLRYLRLLSLFGGNLQHTRNHPLPRKIHHGTTQETWYGISFPREHTYGHIILHKFRRHSEDIRPIDATEYRSLVGSLQYLTMTQLDIA